MTGDLIVIPNSHSLNRHLFIVDNYQLLKALDTECIDLICTDPPFAKNDTFVGSLKPSLTNDEIQRESETLAAWGIRDAIQAEQANVVWPTGEKTAKFKDIWSWEADVHEEWMNDIKDEHPGVNNVIQTTRRTHSEGTAAYLAYMAVRLIECHRVLKPAGSMYLHCDHTANSYLRMLLDAIFGETHFQNEIVWTYGLGGSSPKRWSRKHDTLLFYTKSDVFTFTKPTQPATSQRMKGQQKGMTDVWSIPSLNNQAKERTGYPTQKPVAIAELIIGASSAAGDLVLDPFAGCAYVPVAAERLSRDWIACDISPRAMTVLRRQFEKFGYAVDGQAPEGVLANEGITLARADVTICGPNELPTRTSPDEDVVAVEPLPEPTYKTPASIFSREEMLQYLLKLSNWRAWCCGFANWKIGPDGTPVIEQTTRNFELDHIEPRSKEGRNEIDNRAPLCPSHNSLKGNRSISLQELRSEIEDRGEWAVGSVEELVKLRWARDQAFDHLIAEKARRTKHEFMHKGKQKVRIPNPHRGDIGVDLLDNVLKQAGISREEWLD